MKRTLTLAIILLCCGSCSCNAAWDADKPADSRRYDQRDDDTRANFSALEGDSSPVEYVINVKHPDYGAVGDGSTDDTSAIDSAITAALAAETWVYLPPGTYKYTTSLALESYTKIMGVPSSEGDGTGSNEKGSILYYTGSGDAVTLDGTSSNCTRCYLRDITIMGDGSNDDGIYIANDSWKHKFENVKVSYHGGDGIEVYDAWQLWFNRCLITQNTGNGFNAATDYDVTGTLDSQIHITNSRICYNNIGVYRDVSSGNLGSSGWNISNTSIHDNDSYGVYAWQMDGIQISNCHFESNGGTAIHLLACNPYSITGSVVGGGTHDAIWLESCDDGVVLHNRVSSDADELTLKNSDTSGLIAYNRGITSVTVDSGSPEYLLLTKDVMSGSAINSFVCMDGAAVAFNNNLLMTEE